MELIEAIRQRHSVPRYTDRPATKTFFSPWGYTVIDLGIAKYHFEIGAGKDNYE